MPTRILERPMPKKEYWPQERPRVEKSQTLEKNVHISDTGIESTLRSIHNVTGSYDVTVKKK